MSTPTATGESTPRPDGSLRRVMLSIMPVTASVQIISFLASITMASVLGATRDTDAYYLALLVPSIASGVLLAGLRQGGIPALSERHREGTDDFARSASSLMVAVALVSLIAAIAITAVAVAVMQLALGNWAPEYVDRACTYAIMLIPYTVGGALLGAMGATLAVLGSFRAAVGVGAAEPAVKIALILALPELGGFSLTLGNLGGQAISLAILLLMLARKGFRPKLRSPIRTRFVKRVLLVSAPLVVGQSVIQLNPLIDRAVAASLDAGSITALELATRLIVPPTVLLSSAMVTPLVATWASRRETGGWEAVRGSFTSVMEMLMMASCVFLALGLPLSHALISFLYGGGAFSASAVSDTASTFQVLLLSLPLGLAMIPCSTVFVVAEQTTFPMKVAFGNVVANTALSIPLAQLIGLPGVALGTTITYIGCTAVYIVAIQRRFEAIDSGTLVRTLSFCLAVAVAGAAAAYATYGGLEGVEAPRGWVALVGASTVGLLACVAPLLVYARRRGFLTGLGRTA